MSEFPVLNLGMSLVVLRSDAFLVHSLILSKRLLVEIAIFVMHIMQEYSC